MLYNAIALRSAWCSLQSLHFTLQTWPFSTFIGCRPHTTHGTAVLRLSDAPLLRQVAVSNSHLVIPITLVIPRLSCPSSFLSPIIILKPLAIVGTFLTIQWAGLLIAGSRHTTGGARMQQLRDVPQPWHVAIPNTATGRASKTHGARYEWCQLSVFFCDTNNAGFSASKTQLCWIS